MIEAINLKKSFTISKKKGFFRKEKQTVDAVKGLDLTINKGEIVGLLGLNGAGKTTTIKMLSTLLNPTSGSVKVDGLDIVKDAMEIKKSVNMIAGGERMLYWRLTGRENLSYFGRLYGLAKDELTRKVQALLDEVGLTEAADMPVEQYSKGMKQRLQIARGLINDPSYLFLDEPTLGLDAPIAKQLREMILDLAKKKNKGILLTSHYLEEVEELCDRVYIIDKGQVIEHGTPGSITEKIVKEYGLALETTPLTEQQKMTLEKDLSDHAAKISIVLQPEYSSIEINAKADITGLVISLCAKEGIQITKLESRKPRLEDAILSLAKAGA